MNATDTTLGQIIDGLDIAPTLAPDDLIADAIVILEVIEGDGTTRMCVTYPDGQNFIKRNGLLNLALDMDSSNIGPIPRGDDEDYA